MGSALTFLQQNHDDGNEFLDRIITGDETWVAHITPETKQQSIHWHNSGSPWKTKFKQTLLAQKIMCSVFWDRWGILIDFLTRGKTLNAEHNCETLQKLYKAIQNKRCKIFSTGVTCTIMLGHTWLDGQHICWISAGRRLIIHPIAWTLCPVISIFSYTSRNSCLVIVSIFRMAERQR